MRSAHLGQKSRIMSSQLSQASSFARTENPCGWDRGGWGVERLGILCHSGLHLAQLPLPLPALPLLCPGLLRSPQILAETVSHTHMPTATELRVLPRAFCPQKRIRLASVQLSSAHADTEHVLHTSGPTAVLETSITLTASVGKPAPSCRLGSLKAQTSSCLQAFAQAVPPPGTPFPTW